jgi:hypothetical protein
MAAQAVPSGWPFLIARGRRRGYTVLLSPGFLIADRDYGFLEDVVGPVRDGAPWRTTTVTTPRGRRLCVVWSDYPAEAGEQADLRDEHSRPLRLLGGFLCTEASVAEPSISDIDAARVAALDTYGRFLADEERFTVEESAPFAIRSAPMPLATPRRQPAPVTRRPVRRVDAVLAAVGLAFAALVVVVVILVGSSSGRTPAPCVLKPQVTPTLGLVVTVTPTPAPTARKC